MAYKDIKQYGQMIQELELLITEGEKQCRSLEKAGYECVQNTNYDLVASKCNAKIVENSQNIRESLINIGKIMSSLKREQRVLIDNAHNLSKKHTGDKDEVCSK